MRAALQLRSISRCCYNGSTLSKRFNSNVVTKSSTTIPSKIPVPEPSKGTPVSVKAHFIGTRIDTTKFDQHAVSSSFSLTLAKKEVQMKCMTLTIDAEQNKYITIFNYGSIVFFNISDEEQQHHLKELRKSTISPVPATTNINENYKVIIHENLGSPSVVKAEHVNIQRLDINNVIIISTVMAQTVALDYYATAVDNMLERFSQMNSTVQLTGNCSELSAKELHKLIAFNNSVITTVLSKLGIFEGTDAAWDNADYTLTWEGLRKDFEIEHRFRDLSMKLELVKDDARFFLEVLHNQKSTKLEWIIIILIAGEMGIGLCSLGMELIK